MNLLTNKKILFLIIVIIFISAALIVFLRKQSKRIITSPSLKQSEERAESYKNEFDTGKTQTQEYKTKEGKEIILEYPESMSSPSSEFVEKYIGD